ncbi:MAG: hypothetical protein Q8K93_25775 [Reyranella sp.]|uniref:hypothetical protein n=1 Tax=Reyranella sp. TaxID=1929291 RepID=UPI00272FB9D3|nr:hypothetical protein [Reyranella sp.]MDP1965604.1 hypothetical protein [Reyranella sp.]MDP2377501.1 hypothetical protein [Reyranella sp.]
MSEERNYPIFVIQEALERHLQDSNAARGGGWMVQVMDLLKRGAATVPPPVERTDTIPKYIYPH